MTDFGRRLSNMDPTTENIFNYRPVNRLGTFNQYNEKCHNLERGQCSNYLLEATTDLQITRCGCLDYSFEDKKLFP